MRLNRHLRAVQVGRKANRINDSANGVLEVNEDWIRHPSRVTATPSQKLRLVAGCEAPDSDAAVQFQPLSISGIRDFGLGQQFACSGQYRLAVCHHLL
jgi:hypothetical protein